MIKVTIIDPIISKVRIPDIKFIQSCMEYEAELWVKDKKRKITKQKGTYMRSLIDKRSGQFLTGMLPRIINFCKSNLIELEIIDEENLDFPISHEGPHLNGIVFREDQIELINKVIDKKRGVIIGATGTGKTILILGVISAYKNASVLILCHNLSIVEQTYQELKKFKFKPMIVGDGKQWDGKHNLVISTIQSFSNINPKKYMTHFDITIIDEVHKFSKSYETVMSNNLSPMRLGFTATMPKEDSRRYSIEGHLGRILGKLSINKATKLDILAKPSIKLIPVPEMDLHFKLSYKEIYEQYIVFNDCRNNLIADALIENIEEYLSTLIIVTNIAHGKEIQDILKKQEIIVKFLKGENKNQEREIFKKLLDDKNIPAVITTNIFREGINIRNLDSVILAFGGKSELTTIQTIGRSLRRTETKKVSKIIDFLDNAKYLSQHSISRLSVYAKNGWV